MAVGDIFKEAGKSLVGGLAKAKIEIEDNRIQEDIQVVDIVNNPSSKLMVYTKTDSFIKVSVDDVQKTLKELATKKVYTVRFNPSQLSINAVGGGKFAKTDFSSGSSSITYAVMDPNIQLTVRLIFDDMSVTDSFMNEIATPANGVKKAAHAITKTRNSVQAQVEGFIGALRNEHTRRVIFNWGDLSYKGVLNYMNSEYTMFSIHGRPVRAYVDIGILCTDGTKSGDEGGQWEQKFKDAFCGNSEDIQKTGENLETVGQNVGNLFNINL